MSLIKGFIFLVGLFFLLGGTLLLWGGPWIPWYNSYLVGATLFAYAISILWIGFTNSFKACVGCGLGGLISFWAMAIYFFRLSATDRDFLLTAEIALYTGLFLLILFFIGFKAKKRNIDRIPLSLQFLFVLVAIITLLEGIYLIIPISTHFMWVLPPRLAIPYGWICIGAFFYFAWGFMNPIWENGYPLLIGLLFYNGLMIGPILSLFRKTEAVTVILHLLSIGTIIIIVTGLWALIELCRRLFSVRNQ